MKPLSILIIFFTAVAALTAADNMPAQAQRGSKLFFESTKGLPCATCHQLDGKGTPAGPDLKNIAVVSPHAMVTAILATRTAYVVELELVPNSGTGERKFPAIQHGENPDGSLRYYELSSRIPRLITLKKSDIKSSRDNVAWKHPPESTGYSAEELADVISYIRFITRGVTDPVNPADMKR